jgi:hypothetical protein
VDTIFPERLAVQNPKPQHGLDLITNIVRLITAIVQLALVLFR